MAWLHTWTGLVTGWLLFFVFVTGTVGYFQEEVSRWMTPEMPLFPAAQGDAPTTVEVAGAAQAWLARHAPQAQEWQVTPATGARQPWPVLAWRLPPPPGQRFARLEKRILETADGSVKSYPWSAPGLRATGGGFVLYRMHYELRYMPYEVAIRFVGAATMLMLLAIVSGVVTHKKIFTDFFTFRPAKGQRSWLDAHNLVSVLALPFFLMITYSGLVFFMDRYMPAAVLVQKGTAQEQAEHMKVLVRGYSETHARQDRPHWQASGAAAALVDLRGPVADAERHWGAGGVGKVVIYGPGDAAALVVVEPVAAITHNAHRYYNGVTGAEQRLAGTPANAMVRDLLFHLHEGVYAGLGLRWLYFLSGLLGCAMIATGLVLWTVKRRAKQDKRLKAGQSVAFGFRLVEALNMGTIAGLCTAVAVYFWANRLIPVDFAGRAAWEFHCLFIAWGLLLLHAAVRLRFVPSLRVWQEQLWIAAIAYGLIPVLNWATTDRHLGVTVPHGDWVLAGFDLTVLALGAFFAIAALKVRRKQLSAVRATPRPVRNAASGSADAEVASST